MKNKDRISLIVSIIAIILSGTSLYYSNFQKPDIDFNCGLKMDIRKFNDKSKAIYLPFSFINNSNQSGSILDVKIGFYPINNPIDTSFSWNEIWQKIPEKYDSSTNQNLFNRPLSQTYTLTLLGNTTDYKFINFFPIGTSFDLTPGKYVIKVSILTDYSNDWLSKTYSFTYKNEEQVILTQLK